MSDYVLSEVDLKRCLEALQGEFYRMPSGLTREERRAYMGDIARRNSYGLTPEVASRISENTKCAYLSRFSFTAKDTLKLGDDMMEHYISLSDKVSLTREELKVHGDKVLDSYADTSPIDVLLDEFIDL